MDDFKVVKEIVKYCKLKSLHLSITYCNKNDMLSFTVHNSEFSCDIWPESFEELKNEIEKAYTAYRNE